MFQLKVELALLLLCYTILTPEPPNPMTDLKVKIFGIPAVNIRGIQFNYSV